MSVGSSRKDKLVGNGKEAFVVCPKCGNIFRWPRNLTSQILILLYVRRRARYREIIGKLGSSPDGTKWALRNLRLNLGFARRKEDPDTEEKYYELTLAGRRQARKFLSLKALIKIRESWSK